MNTQGKITQIIGAVVDVSFENDLPEIYTALEVNNGGNKLILEVAQHSWRKCRKNNCYGCYRRFKKRR